MGHGVPFVRTMGDRSVVCRGITYLVADRPLTTGEAERATEAVGAAPSVPTKD